MTKEARFRCGGTLAIVSYIVFSCLSFYFGNLFFRAVAVFIGCLLFFFMLISASRKSGFFCLTLFFIFFSFALINYEWSGFRSIFLVFILIACVGVSWAAFELRLTRIAFEYVFIFFLFLTFVLVVFYDYGPKEFNRFLEGSSRNVYSALMLASAMGYVLSVSYREVKPSIILMLMFVAMSYPLYGRTAIAFSIGFAFCVFALYYKRLTLVSMFFGFLVICFASVYSDISVSDLVEGTNFESGMESERFDILEQYSERLEVSGFLVGQDFTVYPEIEKKDGNPHNAFLRLHGYWGLGVFAFAFACGMSFFLALFHGRPIVMIIILIVFSRAFFDIVYLFNLFDYLFFPSLFYFLFSDYFQRGLGRSDLNLVIIKNTSGLEIK